MLLRLSGPSRKDSNVVRKRDDVSDSLNSQPCPGASPTVALEDSYPVFRLRVAAIFHPGLCWPRTGAQFVPEPERDDFTIETCQGSVTYSATRNAVTGAEFYLALSSLVGGSL